MCKFCEKFDFSSARTEVSRFGASISLAGGSTRFPLDEQFQFCPKCGRQLNGPREVESSDPEGSEDSKEIIDEEFEKNFRRIDDWTMYDPSPITRMILILILLLLEDLTIMLLWNWYVSPAGLCSINFFQAVGIDMMINIIVGRQIDQGKLFMERWADGMSLAGIGLSIGTLLHFFM